MPNAHTFFKLILMYEIMHVKYNIYVKNKTCMLIWLKKYLIM